MHNQQSRVEEVAVQCQVWLRQSVFSLLLLTFCGGPSPSKLVA